jgi:hypothetical protein
MKMVQIFSSYDSVRIVGMEVQIPYFEKKFKVM